jgi:predicted nucleotidyltransferase
MKNLEVFHLKIEELCIQYNVKQLYAFGSVVREDFSQESDVDLIVDFNDLNENNYADNYFDFKFSMEDLLNRKIDLLEANAIRNPYFKEEINKTKELVYGHQ